MTDDNEKNLPPENPDSTDNNEQTAEPAPADVTADTQDESGATEATFDISPREDLEEKREAPALPDDHREKEKEAVEETKSLDEQIKETMNKGVVGKKRKAALGKKIKLGLAALGLLICYSVYSWLFAVPQGDMRYGICKVFVELQVQYPEHMRYSYIRNFRNKVGIWVTHRDSYGQVLLEYFECEYFDEPNKRFFMKKALINRREIDPDIVSDFNYSVNLLFTHKPNVDLPQGLPDGLYEL